MLLLIICTFFLATFSLAATKEEMVNERINLILEKTQDYKIPFFLKGKSTTIIIKDNDNIIYKKSIELEETYNIRATLIDKPNIVCEFQADDVLAVKDSYGLMQLGKDNCQGKDFWTNMMIKIAKIF